MAKRTKIAVKGEVVWQEKEKVSPLMSVIITIMLIALVIFIITIKWV